MHYTWNYLPVPSSLATGDPGTYTYTVRIKGHKSIPIKKILIVQDMFRFLLDFCLVPQDDAELTMKRFFIRMFSHSDKVH